MRITFSGLCYICTPPGECYVLMPRAGQADAGKFGSEIDLHRAALYYDLAYEDSSVPPNTAWAQYSLERWWLDVPVLGSGGPAPTLPQNNFDTLQSMLLGIGSVLPNMLPEDDVEKPALPLNVASHLYLQEGSFDQHPAYACGTINGKPCRLPFEVSWTSPPFTGVLQNCYMRSYLDSYETEYRLPTLTPLNSDSFIDLYVLNGGADEPIGWPPKPLVAGACAKHYAAFYDLVDTTNVNLGSAGNRTVPCQLGPCQEDESKEKQGLKPRLHQHGNINGSYTCMIAGGQ